MHCLVIVRKKKEETLLSGDRAVSILTRNLSFVVAKKLSVLSKPDESFLSHDVKVHVENASHYDLNTGPLEISIFVSDFSVGQGALERCKEEIVSGIRTEVPSEVTPAIQVFFTN